jgi:hypothetical protein
MAAKHKIKNTAAFRIRRQSIPDNLWAEESNHGIQTRSAHDIVFWVTRSGQKEGWPDLLGVFPSEAYARETVNPLVA